jgi:HK97 family phage major capsid protein
MNWDLRDSRKELAEMTALNQKYCATAENINNSGDFDSPQARKDFRRVMDKAEAAGQRVDELKTKVAILEREEEVIKAKALTLPEYTSHGSVFNSLADQLRAVVEASRPGGRIDDRLYRVSERFASGMNQGIGSEGGFMIEPTFAAEILRNTYENGALVNRCRKFPLGENSNGIKLPVVDETSRATGSRFGGVQVYRAAEAATVTATKPKFGRLELNLKKLMALCYVTDELLADSTVLANFLTTCFSEELAFTIDNEILRGGGGAEMLGVLNSPALVVCSKESNQVAATINLANVYKMWGRMWARSRRTAVWLVNQDAEPQLWQLVSTLGSGGVPVYTPPGGASASPYSMLMGRPVIPIEQCSTLGTVGDIVLADFSQFVFIDKPAEAATSMHVRFIYDEQTFRLVYRCDGQPAWKSALMPYKGSNTVSPFVTLETRS